MSTLCIWEKLLISLEIWLYYVKTIVQDSLECVVKFTDSTLGQSHAHRWIGEAKNEEFLREVEHKQEKADGGNQSRLGELPHKEP